MRHVKDILRFTFEQKMGKRPISRSLGISRNTVRDTLRRAQRVGITWPLPEGLSEEVLEQRLFSSELAPPPKTRPVPQWDSIHKELQDHKNLNLTLTQLWIEYKNRNPDGYQISRFSALYAQWLGQRDFVMRQSHKAGEKLFVDYTDGLGLVDPATGEVIKTQLFLAVWGTSTFTYAEASLTQTLPDWIGSHTRAFQYFGVVPRLVVPDNLKSGVLAASLYEPTLNPSYQDMADHYRTAILPARPRKPRDKAKVENGVLIAQRWILAVLRHRVFYSLADFNTAIRELLEKLNDRPLRKIQKSRRALFQELDRPAALSLPERPYEFAQWKKAAVNIDYHIEIDRHYYSVPCQLLRQTVDVKITAQTIEVLFKGQRVAAHIHSRQKGRHTTLPAHMPPAHRAYADWSPSRFLSWAGHVGPHTSALVQSILDSRGHPEQGYRSVLGLLRLAKSVGPLRMESAAARAKAFHLYSFTAVRKILASNYDQHPLTPSVAINVLPRHDNIRGGNYYTPQEDSNHDA